MTETMELSRDDSVLPFQLERSGMRGRAARLGPLLEHILSRHDYPVAVSAMVAELALLTALIGQTIKLRWKLSLQVRGNGAIRTIATDYYAPETDGGPARMRAWASFDPERLQPGAAGFDQLGQGYFAVLIDQGEGTTPYQGMTPLAGGSLASCAQTYFARSEQLPTRFELTVGRAQAPGQHDPHWRAGGIMLQTLPASSQSAVTGEEIEAADILQGAQSEDWNRSTMLLGTVEAMELVDSSLPLPNLVYRLFHEEEPLAFDPQPLVFGCSCNADRVRGTLSIYSAKDIAHMTNEAGVVTADCQFCGAHYEFDPRSLGFEATLDAQGNPLAVGSDGAESRAAP
ncbi:MULTISPECIES: Hsp33 family molecular chaperone HslO [unclassified Paracoccus (in: a-proteobacteria)]|uniref:Hsp33 family molecular chaperone HslO n=1 Tax=unclassified Paracoccus (in: a-proteobacteria) TaxID=2688777 RepID=UPI0012B361B4|nr:MULTISPECIES: Hsp33 family molecular chaperone HslO [unclassified Paracoccus (in: a-proteobacteria)]UXU76043.1 Hsp33 family molecular chaperone HslO [Paracoccus sp. SMMA_5]UXU81954.1 Hsp33 family molecular chaperone HslO [Paracoccus sp. SMMA_5_TC]